MLLIEFHDFCCCAYEGITDLANQGDFVDGIFKAAGSSYTFSTSDRYSHSNYPTKLFNGGKPLSGKIRRSFSNPIDKKGVTPYLEKHIDSDKVRTVMNKFSLPGNAETSLTALSWALWPLPLMPEAWKVGMTVYGQWSMRTGMIVSPAATVH